MDEDKKIAFVPFHAINEFMRADFRLHVIRSTLQALSELSPATVAAIDRVTKKHVRVAGFRNSAKAPATVKAVAMVKSFEHEPKLVATLLAGWAEKQSQLRQDTYQLLLDRQWKILPLEADRAQLPGFLLQWPEEEDYEMLYQAYGGMFPGGQASIDELSLMVVWLAMRLPVEKVSKDELQNFPELQSPDGEEPS